MLAVVLVRFWAAPAAVQADQSHLAVAYFVHPTSNIEQPHAGWRLPSARKGPQLVSDKLAFGDT